MFIITASCTLGSTFWQKSLTLPAAAALTWKGRAREMLETLTKKKTERNREKNEKKKKRKKGGREIEREVISITLKCAK